MEPSSTWPGHCTTELIIAGCATDFGVEPTFLATGAKRFRITVVPDGHTTWERSNPATRPLIEHYDWAWRDTDPSKYSIMVVCINDVILRLIPTRKSKVQINDIDPTPFGPIF